MTDIRLEASSAGPTFRALPLTVQAPAALISYVYWSGFVAQREGMRLRDYMLDSGAYSAFWAGKVIVLEAYADFALERLATDPQCVEVIALDVMRDWRQGQRNTEALWKRGVPAIPVYHFGEPESLLLEYAAASPKICIGTGQHFGDNANKLKFAEQVFARVWPKKIHGLQFVSERIMRRLPFHSVDSSSWIRGPGAWGKYKSMRDPPKGGAPKSGVDLRAEVLWYLALERRMKQLWARELALLDATNPILRARASA